MKATAPGGVLHTWRRAMLPVIASLGVSVIPALIYLRVVEVLDEPVLSLGWPVTLTTDLAFAYFMARVIFRSHPMIPFLLLLGIAADALGFLALALFNPLREVHVAGGMAILAGAICIAAGLRWLRVRSFWPYLLGAGSASWLGLFWSGWHPALALVPIMPFLPHAARDPGFFVDASPDAKDALSQFEIWWKYPAQVTLFFFGLVNAGVSMGALEAGTWGVPIAVIVGKPIGLFVGVGLALLGGFLSPTSSRLERTERRRTHCGDRIQCRALFLCGSLSAGTTALRDENGCPGDPRGGTIGDCRCDDLSGGPVLQAHVTRGVSSSVHLHVCSLLFPGRHSIGY